MELILKYFSKLSDTQINQFEKLYSLYYDWNQKINVISRKDIDNLYLHHVLHSLSISEIIKFQPNTKILDVGTGGGFPGIPLAIFFPEVTFVLIDSIGKKIKVANEVANSISLNNIELKHQRIQEEKSLYDFVVSRAVMPLNDLIKLSKKNISKKQINAIPNGLICLKGGELQQEIVDFKNIAEVYSISNFFNENFFDTKKIVYVPL